MTGDGPLRINPAEAGRFDRFDAIQWWDQRKLRDARVLVAGAGALGNEIVKNLALLGAGRVMIADMDLVENSNLSRSVLFRQHDSGSYKSDVASSAACDIYPQIKSRSFTGNVVHQLGLGVFRWADVVVAGVDNREARLAINRYCNRVNRPWIDGAIEGIQGCARMFVPGGACYECTMSDIDWKILQQRRSCNLLSAEDMQRGRTPTTPTISSIIAGVQCQELVKYLHGMPGLAGRGWVFEGISGDSYKIDYQRKAECYSHETLDEIIELEAGAGQLSARQLLNIAAQQAGAGATLELPRDMLEKLVCPQCHGEEELFTSLASVTPSQAYCPHCENQPRQVETFHSIRGDEPFLDRMLADIGVPLFDILIARGPQRTVGLELSGDAAATLGSLLGGEDELKWD